MVRDGLFGLGKNDYKPDGLTSLHDIDWDVPKATRRLWGCETVFYSSESE